MASSTAADSDAPSYPPQAAPFKLILHCENGSPPYLTPILLSKYFPTTNRMVRDHLVFGIEVRNSFVTPVYGSRPDDGDKKRKKKKNNKEPPPSRHGSNISVSDSSVASTKPTGYTFTGRPLSKHLCIPTEYSVLACSSFDLIDNCESSMTSVSATNTEVTLSTPRGYQKISPLLYRDVVEKMKAPISAVGLYDQASSAKNAKRAAKSVERTKSWLEDNVQQQQQQQQQCPKIWAPIVGGEDMALRMDCLQHASKQSGVVCGFALIGIHHIEDRQARKTMLARFTKEVPNNLPCALLVANDILQILDAARCGVQYIGSALPTSLARSRKALVLDLYGWRSREGERATKRPRIEGAAGQGKGGCISLDDDIFVKDTAPFVEGCSCLACTHHKRAYVHHLINAKELLAEILLFVHNLHHLLALYNEMTMALSTGQQDIFMKHIEDQL